VVYFFEKNLNLDHFRRWSILPVPTGVPEFVLVLQSKSANQLDDRSFESLRELHRGQLHCFKSPLPGLAFPPFEPSRHSAGCFCVSVRTSYVSILYSEFRKDGGGSQISSFFRTVRCCCRVDADLWRFFPILNAFSSFPCAVRGLGRAQCLLVGDLARKKVSLAACWRKITLIFRSDWFLSYLIDWK
jgi:hypothetical protein